MDMMNYVQHVWSMLDNLAEDNPETYRQFINKQLLEGSKTCDLPQPHMCIQCSESNGSGEFFINVMAWPRIPAPKTDEDPVPMIGGPVLSTTDQTNGDIKVVAVALNSQFLDDFSNKPTEQDILVSLAISYVEEQNKVKLSRNFSVCPSSTKYRGDISKLRESLVNVFGRHNNNNATADMKDSGDILQRLVRDATETGTSKNEPDSLSSLIFDNKKTPVSPQVKLVEELSSKQSSLVKPECSQTVVEETGCIARHLVVKVHLPGVEHVKDCCLEISNDDLYLLVPDRYELEVSLHETVQAGVNNSAKFNKRTSCLVLRLPTAVTNTN